MDPCFAIIDRNTLSYMALRRVLQEMFNQVEVFAYNSIEDFIRDSNRHFVHFFVSSDIFFSNTDEFETLKEQTTILSPGPAAKLGMTGCHIIETAQPEEHIIRQLNHLQNTGRYPPGRLVVSTLCFHCRKAWVSSLVTHMVWPRTKKKQRDTSPLRNYLIWT